MADYYTQFSCALDVTTIENALLAYELFNKDPEAHEDIIWSGGFHLSLDPEPGSSTLFLDDGGAGDVEALIAFVLRCAEAFDLKGLWGFEYANTCSKARLDGFGGGAQVIDLGKRETVAWLSTFEWLAAALHGDDDHA
ncbi:MAG: hypothetical protein ACTHLA_13195 [Asticcacaulis sp.]|uniref:hypothetical protein n=1 Tax=Asticcacaulis sp. TaxID=1872648 RepID=UPI003F7BB200